MHDAKPPGSVLQICVGMWTCLGFLAAQVYSMPFRFDEDNVLKAMAEVHLFLMLILGGCTALRSNSYSNMLIHPARACRCISS